MGFQPKGWQSKMEIPMPRSKGGKINYPPTSSEHQPIPTNIGSKMGGAPQNGIPLVLTTTAMFPYLSPGT